LIFCQVFDNPQQDNFWWCNSLFTIFHTLLTLLKCLLDPCTLIYGLCLDASLSSLTGVTQSFWKVWHHFHTFWTVITSPHT
jgi:hypothetical protein